MHRLVIFMSLLFVLIIINQDFYSAMSDSVTEIFCDFASLRCFLIFVNVMSDVLTAASGISQHPQESHCMVSHCIW